jgi:hypothetical protein
VKKLLLIAGFVLLSQLFFAQTKVLPDCKTIGSELRTIKRSFDNIVERFKSKEDKVSLIKTYSSEFSICGEKGKIRDYGKMIEFSFQFIDADYKGGKEEFTALYKKILKELKDVFDEPFSYDIKDKATGKVCIFYEKGKEYSTSKQMIGLTLAYKDPVDEEVEMYFVSLIFTYHPKR